MGAVQTSVAGAGGVEIGLATEGSGPPLLLVHGGMCSATRWGPLWQLLVDRYRVTAMDRRGRGRSGDAPAYAPADEFDDVRAVAEHLVQGRPHGIDVFAHSYGAVCALGATGRGAPVRRMALYEPPGPATVSREWIDRATTWLEDGQTGRALVSFLVEIVGLDPATVAAMRDTPVAGEALTITAATLSREAEALARLDLDELARPVRVPVLFLLGDRSPPWAAAVTSRLHRALAASAVVGLPGQGHEAVDAAPGLVASRLAPFLAAE